MFLLFLLLPLFGSAISQPASKEDVLMTCRTLISKAFKHESIADSLYQKLEGENGAHNLLYGYRGAIEMSFGKHHSNLIKKGRYFSSGKEILETAISKDPNNIELIFLRYTIQYNVPGFLGYKSNLEEDRAMLESAIDTMSLVGLRNSIKDFLKNNQAQ
ncbi:MAG: hypothetical protein WD334_10935 [Chitinophagales bacterium]